MRYADSSLLADASDRKPAAPLVTSSLAVSANQPAEFAD
jgi:hypothetical protein